MSTTTDTHGKPQGIRNLGRFIRFSTPYWPWLTGAFVTGLIRMILPMYMPIFVKQVIDNVLLPPSLSTPDRLDRLWTSLVPLAVILVLHGGATIGRFYFPQVAATHALRDIRSLLFSHLQRLSLAFHRQRPTGTIVSRVINDVNTAQGVFDVVVVQLSQMTLEMIVVSAYLFHRDWMWTLVCLATLPIFLITTRTVSGPMRKASRLTLEAFERMTGRIQERIAMIREVQAFTAEDFEEDRVRDDVEVLTRHAKRQSLLSAFLTGVSEVTRTLGLLIVLVFGVYRVLDGKASVGDVTAFFLYAGMLLTPVQFFTTLYASLQSSSAAADRVFEFLDTEPVIRDEPGALPLSMRRPPAVRFDDVCFSYPVDKPARILDHVSFEAQPGTCTVLVGESGAGKSTLASLIPRFYDIQSGRILIDQQDIHSVTVQSLRQAVGIVPQEAVLFTGTIRDNILYGKQDASEAELHAAALAANVEAFIHELPKGYETVVGERGVGLSGGQIQRIAIARAFLKDPSILIMDEATSNLDAHAEALVMEAIERISKGRTTFIIAHRLSVARRADTILVLDAGRVSESGPHQALLNKGGLYSRLWWRQMGHVEESSKSA